MKKPFFLLIFAFIGAICSITNAQTVRYVKPNATGDGNSWANAAGNIQNMIDASIAGDQVWVAVGTYENIEKFNLKEGVNIYGGFLGNETSIDNRTRSDRDKNGKIEEWEFTNETILKNGINTETSFAIETIVDGFTVEKCGNGIIAKGKILINNCVIRDNTWGIRNEGGTVSNCLITNNKRSEKVTSNIVSSHTLYATGIQNIAGKVIHCVISDNSVKFDNQDKPRESSIKGGGIYNEKGYIINCLIYGNSCTIYGDGQQNRYDRAYGGGVYNDDGFVQNCVVTGNTCYVNARNSSSSLISAYGGGIYHYKGVVVNCCVTNNRIRAELNGSVVTESQKGGGIYGGYSDLAKIYCNTVVNNTQDNISPAVNYTHSYNIIDKDDNLTQNFINPTLIKGLADYSQNIDWRLKSGSQYIEAGTLINLPDWIKTGTDLAGHPRVTNGKISLGAYEYDPNIGIENLNPLNNDIVVYPNPATTELHIQLSNPEPTDYIIYNSIGHMIQQGKVQENATVNLELWANGVYFLKVLGAMKKIIKY